VSVTILMENEFRKYLQERKLSAENTDFAMSAVRDFEEHLKEQGTSFESAGLGVLEEYVSLLIEEGKNSMDRLVAIARYCNLARKNEYYVYFAQY